MVPGHENREEYPENGRQFNCSLGFGISYDKHVSGTNTGITGVGNIAYIAYNGYYIADDDIWIIMMTMISVVFEDIVIMMSII